MKSLEVYLGLLDSNKGMKLIVELDFWLLVYADRLPEGTFPDGFSRMAYSFACSALNQLDNHVILLLIDSKNSGLQVMIYDEIYEGTFADRQPIIELNFHALFDNDEEIFTTQVFERIISSLIRHYTKLRDGCMEIMKKEFNKMEVLTTKLKKLEKVREESQKAN